MQQLALGGGRFEVALLPIPEGNAQGLEQIEFRIAGVAGNEARPLAKLFPAANYRVSALPFRSSPVRRPAFPR